MGLLTGSRLGSERTVDLDALEVLGLTFFSGQTRNCIGVHASGQALIWMLDLSLLLLMMIVMCLKTCERA